MVEVNRQLRDYLPLHEVFDAWLVIAVEGDNEEEDDNGDNKVKGMQEQAPSSSSSSSSPSSSSSSSLSSTEGLATKAAAGIDAVYRWRLQADTPSYTHTHSTHPLTYLITRPLTHPRHSLQPNNEHAFVHAL